MIILFGVGIGEMVELIVKIEFRSEGLILIINKESIFENRIEFGIEWFFIIVTLLDIFQIEGWVLVGFELVGRWGEFFCVVLNRFVIF